MKMNVVNNFLYNNVPFIFELPTYLPRQIPGNTTRSKITDVLRTYGGENV